MAEWARIAATNIAQEIKGYEDETTRNRKLLALLRKRGRILFNQGGDGINWRMKYRRADVEPNDGSVPVSIAQQNKWVKATLDYRGYAVADAMTKRERLKNKGPSAIIKVFENMIPDLIEDIDDAIGDELYVDGYASGNEQRFNGIESMFGTNGTVTIGGTVGAATTGSSVTADPCAYPSDTYGGISTTPGNYGGSWSGSWPGGAGDPEYDFSSPVMVNYPSTYFSATKTWAANCKKALRFGILRTKRNSSKTGGLDLILLEIDMYRQLLDALEDKERFQASGSEMKDLGFGDMISFDGVDVGYEYGLPSPGSNGTQALSSNADSKIGYGFNVDKMELLSMQGALFQPEGPDYDIASRSWRVVVDILGNLKFKSPRHFLKLAAYQNS